MTREQYQRMLDLQAQKRLRTQRSGEALRRLEESHADQKRDPLYRIEKGTAELCHHMDVVAEDLGNELLAVAARMVSLGEKLDAWQGETAAGFAGLRTEIVRLHGRRPACAADDT